MIISLYNLCIYVWIKHGCLANMVFVLNPSSNIIKRSWCISITRRRCRNNQDNCGMVNVLEFEILYSMIIWPKIYFLCSCSLKYWNGKQCRPRSDCSRSLIWDCIVCIYHAIRNFSVQNYRTFTVHYFQI